MFAAGGQVVGRKGSVHFSADGAPYNSAPFNITRSQRRSTYKNGSAKRKVLLVDNARLTRECLFQLLINCCPELDFVGADTTGTLAVYDDYPDLVIFHAHRAEIRDLTNSEFEVVYSRSIPLIAIVDSIAPTQAIDALTEGVAGIFFVGDNIELLVAAIRLVLAGGRFLPPEDRDQSPPAV
jgi:DNA-binding NarL/FixJ family response regulator